eukprot:g16832.t1
MEFKCFGIDQKLQVRACVRATCDAQYNSAHDYDASPYDCDDDYKRKDDFAGSTCAKGKCTRDECCVKRKCKHVAGPGVGDCSDDVIKERKNYSPVKGRVEFVDNPRPSGSSFQLPLKENMVDVSKANDDCGTEHNCKNGLNGLKCCKIRKCIDVGDSDSDCTVEATTEGSSPFFWTTLANRWDPSKNNVNCGDEAHCKNGEICCTKRTCGDVVTQDGNCADAGSRHEASNDMHDQLV